VPRYYLNVGKGHLLIPDSEGDEMPDAEAARELALDTLRDMVRLPHVYGAPREWRKNAFVVTDEQGNQVLTVPFDAVV
jgi:hypothetical protein